MSLIPYVGQDPNEVLRAGLIPNPSTVLALFHKGLDTKQIASTFRNTTEAQAYALLHRAIEAERRK